ncbi:MAG: hypothetical protein QOH47_387 [Sphingomonadales bacterium]|jgi:uncharacterized membrane protein|nr:hypothetical protein [Sphingomonadales bacterium]
MIGWVVLGAALGVFAITALSGRKGARDIGNFFHVDGLRRNALALGIADITLGTGFAYLLTASSQFGWAMLVLPLGVWVGYRLLGWVYRRAPSDRMVATSNILLAIRDGAVHNRLAFDIMITVPLIVVYILFIAYEVFASSQLMAAFIAPNLSAAPAIIGASIVAVSGINSVAGGAQSNWRNDKVLAAGILFLFVVLLVATAFHLSEGGRESVGSGPRDWLAWTAITLLGFLAAVATQFYSLLNSFNASAFEQGSDAENMFRRVGLTIAGALGLLVLVGALDPLDMSRGFPTALGDRLAAIPVGETGRLGLQAVTVVGMVSVVFSTVDTLFMALAYFIRRHLLNRPTGHDATSGESLAPSRRLVAMLAFGIVPPLAGLYLLKPNLFALLLTLGGGAAVYAPLIFAGALALSRSKLTAAPSTRLLIFFLLLFIGSGTTSAVLAVRAPSQVPLASLSWLVVAMVTALIWWLFSGRRQAG